MRQFLSGHRWLGTGAEIASGKRSNAVWIRSVVASAVIVVALQLDIGNCIPSQEQDASLHGWLDTFLWKIDHAMQQPSILMFMLFLLLAILLAKGIPSIDRRRLVFSTSFSTLAGFALVLCESFFKNYSWSLVFGSKTAMLISLARVMGIAVLIFLLINWFYTARIESDLSVRSRRDGLLHDLGDDWKRPVCLFALIILLCWLPYILALYPATVYMDTRDQIAQILGNGNFCWSINHVIRLSDATLLNNHHPVLHTLLIGLFVSFGELIGSYNIAFFCYCILQCLLLAFTLAFQVFLLSRCCPNQIIYKLSLAFSALNPIFPTYGMSVVKDAYYAILMWWLCYLLFSVMRGGRTWSWTDSFSLFFVLFAWLLIRNNGLYIAVTLIPAVALWIGRENRWRACAFLLTSLLTVLFVRVGIQGTLFGAYGISQGGRQEALSVPIMQVARTIRDYPGDLSEDEEELLLELFATPNDSLDDIAKRYETSPDRADEIKGLYSNIKGERLLPEFYRLWLRLLMRHPDSYAQALMALDYSWITFDSRQDNRIYLGILADLQEMLPGFRAPDELQVCKQAIGLLVSIIAKNPATSWMVEFSSYTWVYAVSFIVMMQRRKTMEILSTAPILINYLICFLGPVAYMRYALPAVVALPLLLVLAFGEQSRDRDCSPTV